MVTGKWFDGMCCMTGIYNTTRLLAPGFTEHHLANRTICQALQWNALTVEIKYAGAPEPRETSSTKEAPW